jgi:hypothetical protein
LRGDRRALVLAEKRPRTGGQARVNFFDLARPTIAKHVDRILMGGKSPLELIFQQCDQIAPVTLDLDNPLDRILW